MDDKLAQKLNDRSSELKEKEQDDAEKKLIAIFKQHPMKVKWGQRKEDLISEALTSPDMIL